MLRLPLIIPALVLLTVASATAQYAATSFYLVAHQDDWQYFMGTDAWQDLINPERKVVFIYITAGDACQGTGTCSSGFPYFASREEGAKNSVLAAHGPDSYTETFHSASQNTIRWIDGHAISTWQSGNAVMYFLRLPDGRAHRENISRYSCGRNPSDSSFINLFRRGHFQELSDICGLTTYHAWNELAMTISSVMLLEFKGSSCFIHTHEFSPSLNIGTHPDHRETGLLADFAGKRIAGSQIMYHLDYTTARMKENLTATETETEFKLFMAYNTAKTGYGCSSDFIDGDMEWFRRNYISRIEKSGKTDENMSERKTFAVEIIPGRPYFFSLTVNLPAPDIINCFLFDIHGKTIQITNDQPVNSAGNYHIAIATVPRGIYVFKILSAKGIRTSGKIFIN